MSNDSNSKFIISKAFDKWGDKRWFQALCAFLIVYILLTPVAAPIVYNTINKDNTKAAVTESIDENSKKSKEEHRNEYEKSKQCYAIAKTTMKNYIDEIDCDYMMLIEYHNGTENVMSGIQFCRFDVTLEVTRAGEPYINLDKFKDDIVARYDLLLSDELNNAKGALTYEKDQFEAVDGYFAQELNTIDAQEYSIINILNEDGKICSSLLCVSKKPNSINEKALYSCERELEILFKNTYKAEDVD